MKNPIKGITYKATIAETKLCKNRGGYYTGYRQVQTGKVIEVTCRADSDAIAGWYVGEWIEICGPRRTVRNTFHQEMFERLTLES